MVWGEASVFVGCSVVDYTIGNYVRLVEEVYEKDLISNGKREEYLIQAYLSDLVYNLEDLE